MNKYWLCFIPLLLLLVSCDTGPPPTEGHALLDAKKYNQAILKYNEILIQNPDSRAAYAGKGIAFYYQGLGDSSWANLEKAFPLEKDPEDPYAKDGVVSYYMGLVAYGWLANFEMAESYFQNSVMAGYEESSSFTYLGLCVAGQDPVKALEYFNKAVVSNPEDVFARSNRAFLQATMGIYDKAMTDYDFLLEKEPENHDHWGNRGYCLIGQERWEEARMDFLKALEIEPEYVDGLMYVGVCHLSQGETEKALEYFVAALEKEPTYGRVHYYKGFALVEMGLLPEACEALKLAEANGNQDGIRLREEVCR